MLNLSEYRKKNAGLADFLPWAALIAPGIVLNKDGSFQRTARFRGPDLDSATPSEPVGTTARLNGALRRLGSGWAIFVEAQRNPGTEYPESLFADSASAHWTWSVGSSLKNPGCSSRAVISLPSSGCRPLKKPRAWRAGATRAGNAPASIRGNCSRASSTVLTGATSGRRLRAGSGVAR